MTATQSKPKAFSTAELVRITDTLEAWASHAADRYQALEEAYGEVDEHLMARMHDRLELIEQALDCLYAVE